MMGKIFHLTPKLADGLCEFHAKTYFKFKNKQINKLFINASYRQEFLSNLSKLILGSKIRARSALGMLKLIGLPRDHPAS